MLADPVRAVRVEAVRALAGVDLKRLTQPQRDALESAYRELVIAEMVDADRPEAHLNLGLLDVRRRQPAAAAEAEYNTALRLDPNFVPALANLADLDRMLGRDQQGEELLRKALAIEPRNADIRHSLGLLLVRQHKYAEALDQLRPATELAPDNARYAYVYAIALNSTGAAARRSICWNDPTGNIRRNPMCSWLLFRSRSSEGTMRRRCVTRASWRSCIPRTCGFAPVIRTWKGAKLQNTRFGSTRFLDATSKWSQA